MIDRTKCVSRCLRTQSYRKKYELVVGHSFFSENDVPFIKKADKEAELVREGR